MPPGRGRPDRSISMSEIGHRRIDGPGAASSCGALGGRSSATAIQIELSTRAATAARRRRPAPLPAAAWRPCWPCCPRPRVVVLDAQRPRAPGQLGRPRVRAGPGDRLDRSTELLALARQVAGTARSARREIDAAAGHGSAGTIATVAVRVAPLGSPAWSCCSPRTTPSAPASRRSAATSWPTSATSSRRRSARCRCSPRPSRTPPTTRRRCSRFAGADAERGRPADPASSRS